MNHHDNDGRLKMIRELEEVLDEMLDRVITIADNEYGWTVVKLLDKAITFLHPRTFIEVTEPRWLDINHLLEELEISDLSPEHQLFELKRLRDFAGHDDDEVHND
jgi:hypothetical protein